MNSFCQCSDMRFLFYVVLSKGDHIGFKKPFHIDYTTILSPTSFLTWLQIFIAHT
jgi:hypothetical protein